MRFKKLEELRKRNWVEIVPVEAKKKVVPKINTKKVVKPIGGPSRLRDMIAAARKAKMDSDSSPTSDASTADNAESKTFEAGFFCVRSPIRSPRSTPSKPTLLKAVLSSEAKKSASKQTPINLNATPARSILKSATASDKKAAKKSIKVVLFDDSDNNIQENSDSTEEPFNGFENPPECHNDSGMSSMDVKNEVDVKENKENERGNRKKNRLVRQDATTEDETMVMTRSRRKSINTPKDVPEDHVAQDKTPRRSSRKKNVLQEADSNLVTAKHETPKRMVRSRRSTGLHSVKT
ncbi:unnamed protein product [Diatraea saccharalis]|uniref:Uncharacterized protein n=1 Tax=Diatraea saccharalis TaxID=40085 RepID=A0A9N9RDG4_9NEOP|nr:unnamed protein product [Diatraea saccharalis]